MALRLQNLMKLCSLYHSPGGLALIHRPGFNPRRIRLHYHGLKQPEACFEVAGLQLWKLAGYKPALQKFAPFVTRLARPYFGGVTQSLKVG